VEPWLCFGVGLNNFATGGCARRCSLPRTENVPLSPGGACDMRNRCHCGHDQPCDPSGTNRKLFRNHSDRVIAGWRRRSSRS
jgi:hypothetical protein